MQVSIRPLYALRSTVYVHMESCSRPNSAAFVSSLAAHIHTRPQASVYLHKISQLNIALPSSLLIATIPSPIAQSYFTSRREGTTMELMVRWCVLLSTGFMGVLDYMRTIWYAERMVRVIDW
jgi:hypothetical protein